MNWVGRAPGPRRSVQAVQIYADVSFAMVRLQALKASVAQAAERARQDYLSALDGSLAQSSEMKLQRKLEQEGALMLARSNLRIAQGVIAASGTNAGTGLDIRV